MYGYIYETTNLINGKKYIGKHKADEFDKQYFGSGLNIQKAIKKYGEENFQINIIEKIYTNEYTLNEREKYWINFYNAQLDSNYYNIADGGFGGDIIKGMSKEQKEIFGKKISKGLKEFHKNNPNYQTGQNNPMFGKHKNGKEANMYGKKHTEETKKRIALAHFGKIVSQETKDKLSKIHKGKKISEDVKQLISKKAKERLSISENNPMFGKHHTDETKEKIRQSQIGKIVTEESKNKMSLSHKGFKHSEESKNKMSQSKLGNISNTGKKYVNNGIINKLIFVDSLNEYLYNGWRLGMKCKHR